MTERPDLYAILGVAPSATQAEISRAYRALLRRHHPDTRPAEDESHGAVSDTALQEVLSAYRVLHDPVRRAGYDRQVSSRGQRARRGPHEPSGYYRDVGRPPIIAGPVRWH